MFRTLLIFLLYCTQAVLADEVIREDFDSLDAFKPLTFEKIEKHTNYRIEVEKENSFLVANANSSASGLIMKEQFDIYRYPKLRFRWKVDNVYSGIDEREKSGDDYPVRVYVLYEYNPDLVGFFTRAKYKAAKLVYGEYPPHASLNYVWASSNLDSGFFESPYTDRVMLKALQKGAAKVGSWQVEEVNILEDYKKAFGEEPPRLATMAVMSDADNTGSQAIAYLDYIELFK